MYIINNANKIKNNFYTNILKMIKKISEFYNVNVKNACQKDIGIQPKKILQSKYT